MPRPTKITQAIEDFIRGELMDTPRTTADAIFDKLDAAHPDDGLSYSAVIRRVTKIRKEFKDISPPLQDQLEPWSFGANLAYGIRTVVTPILWVMSRDQYLSIGEARWVDSLYDILWEPIQKLYTDDLIGQCRGYQFIASQYFKLERIAISQGKKAPNTTELDNIYFSEEKIDGRNIAAGVIATYAPRIWEELRGLMRKYNE